MLQSDVRIDLLVTDVGLPGGMNGRQMADAGRVAAPEPEGAVHHRLRRERGCSATGTSNPAWQVLTKPFAMEALAARIREMIDGLTAPTGSGLIGGTAGEGTRHAGAAVHEARRAGAS